MSNQDENTKPYTKVGRPSKYEERFCEELIDHMASGLSFESFAGKIEVNQDTLHEWAKNHPEFSEAKAIAYARNVLFWEEQGIEGLYSTTEYDEQTGKPTRSKAMNGQVWKYNMGNRLKWKEKQPDEVEKGATINNYPNLNPEEITKNIKEKLSKLSPEEIQELFAEKLGEKK